MEIALGMQGTGTARYTGAKKKIIKRAIDIIRNAGGSAWFVPDNALGDGAPNLLTDPESFGGSWANSWGGSGTRTPDYSYVTPDRSPVTKMTATSGGAGAGTSVALTGGVAYTLSCWVATTASNVALEFRSSGDGGAGLVSKLITPAMGFVRESITYTPPTSGTYYVGVAHTVALQICYAWGAKLEQGSTATAYTPQSALRQRGVFTDSLGTTPVTAVGDVLGLMYDRTYTVGAELGIPTTSTAGWAPLGTGASVTTDGAAITVSNVSTQEASAVITGVTVEAGKSYRVSCELVSLTGTGAAYVALGGNALLMNGAAGVKSGIVSVTSGGSLRVATGTATSGDSVKFKNISVKEITGNHATQATTAAKPTLVKLANNHYAMQFDGSNDKLNTLIQQPANNFTLVVAGYRTDLTDQSMGFANAGATAGSWFNNNTGFIEYQGIGGGIVGSSTPIDTNVPHVLTYTNTPSAKALYRDSENIGSGATSTTVTTAADALLALGAAGVNYSGSTGAGVYGFFAYVPTALTDSDRKVVEAAAAYLSGAKYYPNTPTLDLDFTSNTFSVWNGEV